jgi:hypothetical protein
MDEATRERLAAALKELPTAAPPADAWAAIERRTRLRSQRRIDPRWIGVASAAAIAVAFGVAMYERGGTKRAAADIPALVARSQSLEREIAQRPDVRWGDGRAALVYRIADLDRELAPLALDPVRDPRRAERLWRQRVALMQSLSELDGPDASAPVRTVAF